jgi:polysaccharide biosynthesis protein PslG
MRRNRTASTVVGTVVFGSALIFGAGGFKAARAQGLADDRVASGLAVQFTDHFLQLPDWRHRLDLVAGVGATIVRVDLNWDWTERTLSQYNWFLYDEFARELAARGLRPLYILNRPNPLYGASVDVVVQGKRLKGAQAPSDATAVEAFGRWAASAVERFRAFNPLWELWNEPDEAGSWPPTPRPSGYVELARAACDAIKRSVPDAFVMGPAAAQMPTVWKPFKPLIGAVLADGSLMNCLDALSLHTHRFGQAPETVSRDYAVLRRTYLRNSAGPNARKRMVDTEWGDSVFSGGISEEKQALWLPRMYLTNLMEDVSLTNWYCLMDVGVNDREIEHRFGLVRSDGSTRPAYRAYQILARELGEMRLQEVIHRFEVQSARGATVLRFCDSQGRCKLAAWSTEVASPPERILVSGWRAAGPAIGHLGEQVGLPGTDAPLRIELTPAVQYIPVTREAGAARR